MTTIEPFKVKSPDGIAQWEKMYAYFKDLPYGHEATYDAVLAVTGIDLRINRMPIYRCIKELEDADRKTLVSVHGVGYKVANPNEHESLARRHHKSARRQVGKAVRKARSANRSLLSPVERAQIDAVEITLSRHADLIRRLDGRVAAVEKAQRQAKRDVEAKVGDVTDQVQRLEESLRRRGLLEHDETEAEAEAPATE